MEPFVDTVKTQETTQTYRSYVNDLRRLFIFHGLSCDKPDSLDRLAAKMSSGSAFTADLSSLCRAVRDLEHGQITADQMQGLITAACGGETPVADRGASAGKPHSVAMVQMLLAGIGGWRETDGVQLEAGAHEPLAEAAPAFVGDPDPTPQMEPEPTFATSRSGLRLASALRLASEMHHNGQVDEFPPDERAPAPEMESNGTRPAPVAPPPDPIFLADEPEPAPVPPAQVPIASVKEETTPMHTSSTEKLEALRSLLGKEPAPPHTAEEHVEIPAATHTHLPLGITETLDPEKRKLRQYLAIAALLLATVGIAALVSSFVPQPKPQTPQASRRGSGQTPAADTSAPVASATPAPTPQPEAQPVETATAAALPPSPVHPDNNSRKPEPSLAGRRTAAPRVASPTPPRAEVAKPKKVSPPPTTAETKAVPVKLAELSTAPDRSTSTQLPEAATPAADGRRLIVPEATMQKNLIFAKPPVYPQDAIKQQATGTVVLNAFIDKDGSVRRMDVVEGPYIFVKSALAAVSWRRYRPYLVHGQPVEVETKVTVKYPPH